MARRIRDAFAYMPAAGKVDPRGTEPVITADIDAPPTPKHVAVYRKSHSRQPGRRSVHYGIARDEPPPNIRFGRRSDFTVGVTDCLYDPTAIGVAAVANEQAERVYASRRREPLGQTPQLSKLPDHVHSPFFVFGMKSNKSENAKEVIYGNGITPTDAVTEQERAAPVGQGRSRNYNWAAVNIDPTKHRFGRSTLNQVQDVPLKPTQLAPMHPSQRAPPATAGFAKFDKPYAPTVSTFALVDVGDSREEDLGHPTIASATLRRLRAKSSTPSGATTGDRVFGVPTIRSDIPRPKEMRFANANNYGDDATAGTLLNPSGAGGAFVIDERDYSRTLSKDAALRTLNAAGVPEEQRQAILSKATARNAELTARDLRQAMIDAGF